MKIQSVSQLALRDISQWIREKYAGRSKENIITRIYLDCKETRRLNKELGLDIINKKK